MTGTQAAGEGGRKVAYYCVATHLGGAERSLLDLVRRVEAQSVGWYRPWVILPAAEGPLVDALQADAIPYSVLPMPRGLFGMSRARPVSSLVLGALQWPVARAYLGRLAALVREQQPALVHTTGIKCHALAARLGRQVPVLWHLRDIMTGGVALGILRRLRHRPGVHVIANSYATALAFDPAADDHVVVYNGIDTARFVPGRDQRFRARFGVGDEVPIIGIVGVIARGKGIDAFLEMAAQLRGKGVDARYVVVGSELYDTGRDRGLQAELAAHATALELDDVLAFVGYDPDTVGVMQGLDVLVSASTHPESFGRVVVEAMACGVPVVASAIGGSLELIDDQVCGRLFPAGDVPAMTRAVHATLVDPAERAACAARARARVEQRFRLGQYVAGVVRTYDRILGAQAGPTAPG